MCSVNVQTSHTGIRCSAGLLRRQTPGMTCLCNCVSDVRAVSKTQPLLSRCSAVAKKAPCIQVTVWVWIWQYRCSVVFLCVCSSQLLLWAVLKWNKDVVWGVQSGGPKHPLRGRGNWWVSSGALWSVLTIGHEPKLFTGGREKWNIWRDMTEGIWLMYDGQQWAGILSRYVTSQLQCVPKTVHLFIFWITLSKITDFNDFWYVNPEKIWHQYLTDLSMSDVSTLPREVQKSHFYTCKAMHISRTTYRNIAKFCVHV